MMASEEILDMLAATACAHAFQSFVHSFIPYNALHKSQFSIANLLALGGVRRYDELAGRIQTKQGYCTLHRMHGCATCIICALPQNIYKVV